MKAVIDVSPAGSAVHHARQQLVASASGQPIDFRLSFESARALFAEITPARLDLLDTLRRTGASSVYGLAKSANRNYSNVHTDVAKLQALGLLERTEDDRVTVPFEAIEIVFPLAKAA